jgi:hypothetical protein
VLARRVRAGAEMKGTSSIPAAVAIIPSPLLWRVKVNHPLYSISLLLRGMKIEFQL